MNRAYETFLRREELKGKLGVFWHTQGSGKSFSMIFYARKIFRKQTGNFTFVVVTDRDDLDGQIYRNFLHTGTVTKAEAAQPKDSEEMRKFLGQNKRLVFTLIQKFRWDKGKEYPRAVAAQRHHRDRGRGAPHAIQGPGREHAGGLKNAQYLAFTGTPLLGRERKTNQWFGDYVSEYNFQQSMDDGATVPLFYEKRVPQVLIQNDDLSEEFCRDSARTRIWTTRSRRSWRTGSRRRSRSSSATTGWRPLRRTSFTTSRGAATWAKGMVVSLDKFTAVKMYDKVQRLWKEQIKELRGQIKKIEERH